MRCKYEDSWTKQEKCESFKRNSLGRCKFINLGCPVLEKSLAASKDVIRAKSYGYDDLESLLDMFET